MANLEKYNDVIENLGVVIHGLPVGGVKLNTNEMMTGTCLLVNLKDNIRCKAERFPVEITGRVTEHWGVRNEDGSVEVFVLKVKRIYAYDTNTTPQKKVASMLSLLVEKDANLIIMHDKLLHFGCLCGAFMGSRISGEKVIFIQPKPLNEYDPYAASVVETELLADDVIELLAAMQELAAKKAGVEPEQTGPKEADEPAGDDPDQGEQPEESAPPEETPEAEGDGYEAGAISEEGMNELLKEMGGEPNPDGESGSPEGEPEGGNGDDSKGAGDGDDEGDDHF